VEAARQQLAKSSNRLEQQATDVALFRAVQESLLGNDRLRSSNVVAHVRDGVVTLYGTVPDAQRRDRAVEVARSTPGVSSVESQIVVRGGAEEAAGGNGSSAGSSSGGSGASANAEADAGGR